jgi:hypothetical protein
MPLSFRLNLPAFNSNSGQFSMVPSIFFNQQSAVRYQHQVYRISENYFPEGIKLLFKPGKSKMANCISVSATTQHIEVPAKAKKYPYWITKAGFVVKTNFLRQVW